MGVIWYSNRLKKNSSPKIAQEDGIFREWYTNRQIKHLITYQFKKRNGIRKKWAENGELIFEGNYKDDRLNGIIREWYETGILKSQANYSRNEKSGWSRRWYKNGALESERNYVNGIEDSNKFWDENGKLISINSKSFGINENGWTMITGKSTDVNGDIHGFRFIMHGIRQRKDEEFLNGTLVKTTYYDKQGNQVATANDIYKFKKIDYEKNIYSFKL